MCFLVVQWINECDPFQGISLHFNGSFVETMPYLPKLPNFWAALPLVFLLETWMDSLSSLYLHCWLNPRTQEALLSEYTELPGSTLHLAGPEGKQLVVPIYFCSCLDKHGMHVFSATVCIGQNWLGYAAITQKARNLSCWAPERLTAFHTKSNARWTSDSWAIGMCGHQDLHTREERNGEALS